MRKPIIVCSLILLVAVLLTFGTTVVGEVSTYYVDDDADINGIPGDEGDGTL